MAGLFLNVLWWQWPQWQRLEALGTPLPGITATAQPRIERNAWRGLLQVALPVFFVLAGGLCLAWPGLLLGQWRWVACLTYAGLLPVAPALLQAAVHWDVTLPAAMPMHADTEVLLHGLPVVEMAEPVLKPVL